MRIVDDSRHFKRPIGTCRNDIGRCRIPCLLFLRSLDKFNRRRGADNLGERHEVERIDKLTYINILVGGVVEGKTKSEACDCRFKITILYWRSFCLRFTDENCRL